MTDRYQREKVIPEFYGRGEPLLEHRPSPARHEKMHFDLDAVAVDLSGRYEASWNSQVINFVRWTGDLDVIRAVPGSENFAFTDDDGTLVTTSVDGERLSGLSKNCYWGVNETTGVYCTLADYVLAEGVRVGNYRRVAE